ncbi:hypothetical protein [Pseudoxanthomonas mexicana]|uniref:hypothetical protein n=1 Tax=Pseudoxanthomonas mexicana TaxID=128785 RepID=UPI00398A621C
MNEPFLDKVQRLLAPATQLLERIGFVWLWLLVSVLLLGVVVVLNPAKLGAYVWFMSKTSGAFALGYGFDWAAFRGADPRYLDGIEKTMAQTRRATLIAAAIIGAGLIG